MKFAKYDPHTFVATSWRIISSPSRWGRHSSGALLVCQDKFMNPVMDRCVLPFAFLWWLLLVYYYVFVYERALIPHVSHIFVSVREIEGKEIVWFARPLGCIAWVIPGSTVLRPYPDFHTECQPYLIREQCSERARRGKTNQPMEECDCILGSLQSKPVL